MKGMKDKVTGRFKRNLEDKTCLTCEKEFHPRFSDIKFCSRVCMGKSYRKNHERNCIMCLKSFSAKSLKTRFCSQVCVTQADIRTRKGSESHLWKGGITPKNIMIRMSLNYRNWRKAVYARDNFTCQECGTHGVQFHAHHLKSFAEYPELRFAIDNGVTLCVPCHKKTDSFLKRIKKNHHVI